MNSFIETLNHLGDDFLNLAWPMFWQSSLLIAIVFTLDFALRWKIRATIRYVLWLIVLVKLLLPPSLALPTSVTWWLPALPQPSAKQQTTVFVVTYGDQIAPIRLPPLQPAHTPVRPKVSSAAWTLAISGAVSGGLLAWLLFLWLQIHQKVRRAKASEKLAPILDEARRLTGLRPGLRLKLTEDSMSPAVCGLFRPVILLPHSLVGKLSAGQLRAVLLHEAIHLRRGDVWMNCAQALLQIVYWWHPLLWVANARVRRVREEAVDDAVMLALCDDAEIYAPTLLEVAKLAFNRPLASLGLVGILESRSALRQRIERLVDFDTPRKAGLTIVSILGILAFSAVALPMGEAPEKTNMPATTVSNLANSATASDINTNTVTGILSDTNFQTRVRALEQRARIETLAEPEPVSTAGQGANQISRMVVPDKINIPSMATNAAESGKLVQDGKLLYEMGRFEEANVKLNQALKLDPNSKGALFYLSLTKQAINGRKGLDRAARAGDATVEVSKAWSPKAGYGLPVPNPYAVNTNVHTSASSDPNTPQLEMRVFKVDTKAITSAIRGVRNLQTNDVVTMAINLFSKLGVDLTAPGRSIAFQDRLGLLFVKATPSELDTIERAVQALNQIPPQIHIKARFIELPKDGFVMPTAISNTVAGQMTGILTDTNFRVMIQAMEKRTDVETLAEPEAVTISGRQTQMRATDIVTVLTNINPLALKLPGVSSTNNDLFMTEQVGCGPVFDVVPYVLSDGYTLNLTTTASVTEFLGYDTATNSVTVYIDGHKQTVPVPLPKFRTQKISTVVNLWDDQTLVLGGPVTSAVQTTKDKVPLLGDLPLVGRLFQNQTKNSVEKRLMVFVTATIVDPAGNRVHSDSELPFNPSTIPPQPEISIPSR
jgi:beta-lactamase regulating signal transducer with metallopeptidase domain/Flp pilus assembly secretin CpaC